MAVGTALILLAVAIWFGVDDGTQRDNAKKAQGQAEVEASNARAAEATAEANAVEAEQAEKAALANQLSATGLNLADDRRNTLACFSVSKIFVLFLLIRAKQ